MKFAHVTDKFGNSEVHKAGCSHTRRRVGFNHYLEFEAPTKVEAIKELWHDQMIETGEAVETFLDRFAPCLKGIKE